MQGSHNPRNLREKYQTWVGKKVTVGTRSFHYLCGRWKAIEGYDAIFTIGTRDMRLRLDDVDNVAEASDALAEYFK